jgi:hypothetical protein
MIEQRRRKDLACPPGARFRRRIQPVHPIRKGAHGSNCHHRRCLENRSILARGLGLQVRPDLADRLPRRQSGRRQRTRFLLDRRPLCSQAGNVERRSVDGRGQACGGALEPIEQLIGSRELHVSVEQSLSFERVSDFGNQMTSHAADIGERRQHPYGRGSKRDDAEHLDGVPRGPSHQKVIGQRVAARIHAFGAANLFDEESQRGVHQVLIQPGPSKRRGKNNLTGLARRARAEPEGRANDPLGKRKQVPLECHALVAGLTALSVISSPRSMMPKASRSSDSVMHNGGLVKK